MIVLFTLLICTLHSGSSDAGLVLADIQADWQDAQNPNGNWRFFRNSSQLFTTWYPDYFGNGSGQGVWADQPYALQMHVPFWYRVQGTGVIRAHGSEFDRTGTNVTSARWTSDYTGQIEIFGEIWSDTIRNRLMGWSLGINGVAVSSGTIFSDGTWHFANRFSMANGSAGSTALMQEIATGDVVDLTLTSLSLGGNLGDTVELGLIISAVDTPSSSVPEPAPFAASLLLSIFLAGKQRQPTKRQTPTMVPRRAVSCIYVLSGLLLLFGVAGCGEETPASNETGSWLTEFLGLCFAVIFNLLFWVGIPVGIFMRVQSYRRKQQLFVRTRKGPIGPLQAAVLLKLRKDGEIDSNAPLRCGNDPPDTWYQAVLAEIPPARSRRAVLWLIFCSLTLCPLSLGMLGSFRDLAGGSQHLYLEHIITGVDESELAERYSGLDEQQRIELGIVLVGVELGAGVLNPFQRGAERMAGRLDASWEAFVTRADDARSRVLTAWGFIFLGSVLLGAFSAPKRIQIIKSAGQPQSHSGRRHRQASQNTQAGERPGTSSNNPPSKQENRKLPQSP